MRRHAAALFLVLATASPTLADEAPAPPAATPSASSPTRIGLGVSLGSGSTVAFMVPLRIGRSFRLEPELGILDVDAVMVGIGLAWTFPVADQVQGYAGVRLQSWSSDFGVIDNYRAAVVAGGEWLPAPRVSLGVEAQLGYGRSSASPGGFGPGAMGRVDTAGLFIARIYIW